MAEGKLRFPILKHRRKGVALHFGNEKACQEERCASGTVRA